MRHDDDDEHECECEEGAPEWLATFADLMSLLMCFFVLLLSFSEMDIQQYKQVAGSMSEAFGVQRSVTSDEIPRGTTVIAQEFSPGKPEPTVIEQMRQQTSDESKPLVETDPFVMPQVDELLEQVTEALEEEIEAEILEVLPTETGVKIRVREKDAFPSGSAVLQRRFTKVLDKLTEVINGVPGDIIVEGHTDDIPIATSNYPSNWVLSAARAASVVHYMTNADLNDPTRVEIRAHADTVPIVPNTNASSRARNRRVEINISLPFE